MISTTILIMIIFSLVYPVLTREKITRGRAIWLFKQQKRKEHLKEWKPMNKDSELVISKSGVALNGSWRTRPKLRNRLRDKKTKIIGKVCVSLVIVLLISYILSSPLILFGVGAAFTSKASGDWDAVGQTTWNEVNAPVSGDTVQINNTHNVRIDNGTGNEACLSIDVQTGGTLTIDSEAGGALSLTFDDAAGAGFDDASAGQFTAVGTAGNIITITSTGAPPTTFYHVNAGTLAFTMDYVTIEWFDGGAFFRVGAVDVDNCTFQNNGGPAVISLDSTITSFTNNTIAQRTGIAFSIVKSHVFDNIVITGTATIEVFISGVRLVEFTNSNFDVTKVTPGTGTVISDTHGDVAGDWYIWNGSNARNKSDLTNDFISSDNVTIYEGELVCDEATAHNNLTIKTGGTLNVSPNVTQTVTNTGTITVESGGTLDWTGSVGNLITLVSDAGGTQWSLDAQNGSTVTVSYVDVTDSDASGGDAIDATDGTSVNGGNNDNWNFGAVVTGQKSFNYGFTTLLSVLGLILKRIKTISKGVEINENETDGNALALVRSGRKYSSA